MYQINKAKSIEMSSNDIKNKSFRHDIQLFAIGFAISLIAKGIALFPIGFSPDSYPKIVAMSEYVSGGGGPYAEILHREVMAQGRVGQWALIKILTALGIIGPGGNTLYALLSLSSFVVVGILLCRLWSIKNNILVQVCIVGVFAIHPYHAEVFTFREATLVVGLAICLAMLGIVIAERRFSRWIMGTFLIVLSLTLYQIAINYVVIALAILAILYLSRGDTGGISGNNGNGPEKPSLKALLSRCSAVVAAIVVYIPIYKIAQHSVRWTLEHKRGTILPLSDIPGRLWYSTKIVGRLFLVPEPVMPIFVKMSIIVLALLAIGLVIRKIWKTASSRRYLTLAIIISLFTIAGFGIVGVLMPLKMLQINDRTIAGVSVLVAGFLALIVMNGEIWATRSTLIIACILMLSFAGANNVILSEQLRLNVRDMATASNMMVRLEANSKFAAVKKIAVIGIQHEYPLHFIKSTHQHLGSASAFSQPWSKAKILQVVSGYSFNEPNNGEKQKAENYCRNVPPWPDPASVTILKDTAVICLSNE